MYLPEFTFHRPVSLEDACRILADSSDGAALAGGTDLLVEMKQGMRRHQDIVSLAGIAELRHIRWDGDVLSIGAGMTHNAISVAPSIRESFPAIAEAAAAIGTDQVRNTGTVGGNLCTGATCSDMAPVLIALGADVEIRQREGTRVLPLEDFFVNHRKTRLQRGEVMTRIMVRRQGSTTATRYEKFGLRAAASIAVASVAVALTLRDEVCSIARVVIGAVAPTPMVSRGASATLAQQPLALFTEDSPLLQAAGAAAAADSIPIDDLRGSSDFRRTIIQVLTKRAVLAALSRAR